MLAQRANWRCGYVLGSNTKRSDNGYTTSTWVDSTGYMDGWWVVRGACREENWEYVWRSNKWLFPHIDPFNTSRLCSSVRPRVCESYETAFPSTVFGREWICDFPAIDPRTRSRTKPVQAQIAIDGSEVSSQNCFANGRKKPSIGIRQPFRLFLRTEA